MTKKNIIDFFIDENKINKIYDSIINDEDYIKLLLKEKIDVIEKDKKRNDIIDKLINEYNDRPIKIIEGYYDNEVSPKPPISISSVIFPPAVIGDPEP